VFYLKWCLFFSGLIACAVKMWPDACTMPYTVPSNVNVSTSSWISCADSPWPSASLAVNKMSRKSNCLLLSARPSLSHFWDIKGHYKQCTYRINMRMHFSIFDTITYSNTEYVCGVNNVGKLSVWNLCNFKDESIIKRIKKSINWMYYDWYM